MPDVKISELSQALQISDSAKFPYAQDNSGTQTTFGAPMSQMASKIAEDTTFANLNTTSKNIIGAINEVAQGGGGSVDITTEIDTPSAIQTFSDGGDNIPMKSLEVAIVAQQASGTPSPSNPLPITGFSSVNVVDCGKNLFDKTNSSNILECYLYRSSDNTYRIASGSNVATAFVKCKPNTTYTVSKIVGSRFIIGWTKELPVANIQYYDSATSLTEPSLTITTGNEAKYIVAYFYNGSYPDGHTYNDYVNSLQIEENNQATTYEPYTGTTTPVSLGQTIYGGTADLVNGTGIKTHENIASYNGEAINEPWLCSQAPFVSGTTPPTGSQVVYPLTTPTAFTFTGANIPTLLGVNNVYADSGDVNALEYFNDKGDDIASMVRLMTRT